MRATRMRRRQTADSKIDLVRVPTGTLQENDFMITVNSAFGPQSFRNLVDRPGSPGHRREFDGSNGKTHANVADRDVAADVAGWLAEIEESHGDMQPFKRKHNGR